jgi:hypothetical protein
MFAHPEITVIPEESETLDKPYKELEAPSNASAPSKASITRARTTPPAQNKLL